MKKTKNLREDFTKATTLKLSEKDQKTLIYVLGNSPKPNQALIKAFKNYERRLG